MSVQFSAFGNRTDTALSKTSIFGRDSVGPTLVGQGSTPRIQCPTKIGPTGMSGSREVFDRAN